ncbi:MAG: MFS transporter [Streptococcaceae bacterium]|jgi:MFS family permease|nr:MFS transporter [Streptococcaceae bacterium]
MKKFNEKYLYLYKFIGQCLPIYSFYQLLFLENGISITQITFLMIIWNIAAMVFELPMGVIADKFNRRNLLVVSSFIQSIGFFVWSLTGSFWTYALGFILWGLASAMVTGTESSLIYDNLKYDDRQEEFTEIFGKAEFFGYLGVIVAIVSAGFLINFLSVATIALISAIVCFINAGLALGIREKNYYSETKENVESQGSLKEIFSFFKNNHLVFLLFLFFIFFAGFGAYLDEFDPFIAIDFERGPMWISAILVIRFAFMALGDLLAPWFEKKMNSITPIILLTFTAYIILGVFAFIWNVFALVLFGLSFMLLAIASVLITKKLQDAIEKQGRATIMSFVGLAQSLMMIVVSLFFGGLAGVFSVQQIYLFFAAFGLIGCVVMLPMIRVVERVKDSFILENVEK